MIDSFSEIVMEQFDASPKDVILYQLSPAQNPANRYPEANQVSAGITFGPGAIFSSDGLSIMRIYQNGTLVPVGASAVYHPIGSAIIRKFGR